MSFFLILFGTILIFAATVPMVWRVAKPAERNRVPVEREILPQHKPVPTRN